MLVKRHSFHILQITDVSFFQGDIFEREEDIEKPEIWRSEGGSADPERQERSRLEIIQNADWIVPGHGPMFKVTEAMKAIK